MEFILKNNILSPKLNSNKITSAEVLEWFEKIEETNQNNKSWIDHCKCVGNSAAAIAKILNLDTDKAKTLGYLHDIGIYTNNEEEYLKHPRHVINGFNYLKSLGLDEEYANICLTHSFLKNDINCVAGGGFKNLTPEEITMVDEFIKNHEYTYYEKIINLCDLICTNITMTMDERLLDLLKRRAKKGQSIYIDENTLYHIKEAYQLKQDIDGILGFNVYNLFTDVDKNQEDEGKEELAKAIGCNIKDILPTDVRFF